MTGLEGVLAEPLAKYGIVATTDPAEMWQVMSRIFRPCRFELRGRCPIDGKLNRVSLGRVSLNYLRHGGDMVVDPGALDDFFFVSTVLKGTVQVRVGEDEAVIHPGDTIVVVPHRPNISHWTRESAALMVQIDRRAFERFVEDRLKRRLRKPIEFPLDGALRAEGARRWRDLVSVIIGSFERDDRTWSPPLMGAAGEELLMAALLSLFPHSFTDALTRADTPVRPYYVKRAQEFIHAHADRPIAMAALTKAAGVSERTLYAGFRRFKGIGPMGYAKQVRLERVRNALLHAAPGETTVTEVALRWGFASPGHFALEYRARFGEAPSETLRRRPA